MLRYLNFKDSINKSSKIQVLFVHTFIIGGRRLIV